MILPKTKDLWSIIYDTSLKDLSSDNSDRSSEVYLDKLRSHFKTKILFKEECEIHDHDSVEDDIIKFCNETFFSWYLFCEDSMYIHREQDATLFLIKFGEYVT